MTWKPAVLSARVCSARNHKRDLDQLKDLTIEERRQKVIDNVKNNLNSTQPVSISWTLSSNRVNRYHSLRGKKHVDEYEQEKIKKMRRKKQEAEKNDKNYDPTNMRKGSQAEDLYLIPVESTSGEYKLKRVISGYCGVSGADNHYSVAKSVPADTKKIVNIFPQKEEVDYSISAPLNRSGNAPYGPLVTKKIENTTLTKSDTTARKKKKRKNYKINKTLEQHYEEDQDVDIGENVNLRHSEPFPFPSMDTRFDEIDPRTEEVKIHLRDSGYIDNALQSEGEIMENSTANNSDSPKVLPAGYLLETHQFPLIEPSVGYLHDQEQSSEQRELQRSRSNANIHPPAISPRQPLSPLSHSSLSPRSAKDASDGWIANDKRSMTPTGLRLSTIPLGSRAVTPPIPRRQSPSRVSKLQQPAAPTDESGYVMDTLTKSNLANIPQTYADGRPQSPFLSIDSPLRETDGEFTSSSAPSLGYLSPSNENGSQPPIMGYVAEKPDDIIFNSNHSNKSPRVVEAGAETTPLVQSILGDQPIPIPKRSIPLSSPTPGQFIIEEKGNENEKTHLNPALMKGPLGTRNTSSSNLLENARMKIANDKKMLSDNHAAAILDKKTSLLVDKRNKSKLKGVSEWINNYPLDRSSMTSLWDDLQSSDEENPSFFVFTREEQPENEGSATNHKNQWTERFQSILQKIRGFDANTPLDDLIEGNAELLYLAQDFLHCAQTYGRIIIAERYLPVSEKTIKPVDLGGVAGGEKYIVHNILFKFAVDSYSILGSDYAALKVAGNELKGLISYFNCQITDLRVPLMALVDYMGFRVVAMSVLPINNKTLVYGTNDGGVVIHNSNFKLHELMKQAAEIINIKKHICGLRTASGKRLKGWQELYSPADLEGHCGDDGSFYLVDFARTMPPEAPPPNNKKRQHLYKLLRPEFVKAWDIPLCPDSFSGFILADDNYNVHNQQVKVATEYLYHEHIPRFVRDSLVWQIIEAKERNKLHKFPLTEAIHSKGICLRHIGLILYNVRDEEEFKIVKIVLVIEAIARVLKNKLRGLLRRKMKSLKQPLEAPYRHLVVKFLNLVFGTSQASEEFWQNIIKPQLKSKFVITGIWTDPIFPLKTWLVNNSHALCACLHLFNRVVSLTGLKFTNLALNKFKGPISFGQLIKEPYPFDDTYLHEIGYRVKHMNIIAEALGSYYYYKGLRQSLEGDSVTSLELFKVALDHYEEALGSNPTNTALLKNAAICCTRRLELNASGGAHLEDVQFNPAAADIQKADQYYIRAVASDPDDAQTLYSYAKFLWRCGRLERAEEYFLQSLEADPNFVWCLRDYGVLLSELKQEEIAEQFFIIASKRTTELTLAERKKMQRAVETHCI